MSYHLMKIITLGLLSNLEIPEGGAEPDESPLVAAKRELKEEETGLSAKKWTPLLDLHPSNAITNELATIFLAQDLSEGCSHLDDTEDITLLKLPFSEVVKMVLEGKITDSITVATILKAKILLGI